MQTNFQVTESDGTISDYSMNSSSTSVSGINMPTVQQHDPGVSSSHYRTEMHARESTKVNKHLFIFYLSEINNHLIIFYVNFISVYFYRQELSLKKTGTKFEQIEYHTITLG